MNSIVKTARKFAAVVAQLARDTRGAVTLNDKTVWGTGAALTVILAQAATAESNQVHKGAADNAKAQGQVSGQVAQVIGAGTTDIPEGAPAFKHTN